MLTQKQELKFNTIVRNYVNGNLSDCKENIRKLNKYNLACLMCYWSELPELIGNDKRERFFNFIVRSLEA